MEGSPPACRHRDRVTVPDHILNSAMTVNTSLDSPQSHGVDVRHQTLVHIKLGNRVADQARPGVRAAASTAAAIRAVTCGRAREL
jgi:hypothetical protein